MTRRTRPGLGPLVLIAGVMLAAGPSTAQLHIVAVGDSLTAGGDWLVHIPELQPGWTWEEHGLPGEDSWDAADAIHCSPNPEMCNVTQSTGRFRSVLAARTRAPEDVIVLMWGTNDVRKICWSDANPTGPEDCRGFTRAALEQMIDDALAEGYPVVVGMSPPIINAPNSPHTPVEVAEFDAHLWRLRGMIVEIVDARPHRRLAIGNVFQNFGAQPGWVDTDYYRAGPSFSDGLHPGIEAGPSGASGRFHVAESLVAAAEVAASFPVPGLGAAGAALLIVVLGGSAVASPRIRPNAALAGRRASCSGGDIRASSPGWS